MYSDVADTYYAAANYSYIQHRQVKYIVLHTTQGSGLGSMYWLANPSSGVSAHYLVMENGELVAMVHEEYAAWHAGSVVGEPVTDVYTGVNPNFESIGIEIAGYAATPISPDQVRTTVALIRDIWNRYGKIPVVQHAWLSPGNRSDPGDFNYNWIMTEAEEEEMPSSEEIYAAVAPLIQERVVAPQADTNKAIKDALADFSRRLDAHQHSAGELYNTVAALIQEKVVAPQADTNKAIKDELERIRKLLESR